jgi:hypothetical protein
MGTGVGKTIMSLSKSSLLKASFIKLKISLEQERRKSETHCYQSDE